MLAFFFAMTLCGCGPNASQIQFRQAVAAMKVCTQDATYNEFREKRLALEACYAANQTALTSYSTAFNQLAKIMQATDRLWNHPGGGLLSERAFPEWTMNGMPPGARDFWEAMLIINPKVAAKANFTFEQCQRDPEFVAQNYVHWGLKLISEQCDELLGSL